ncbi:Sec23/Sec24 trunk domain-containing protein [Fennellomyces sp. T-0311]|nr:Sec23/Sec24 trunk domain-containing protein [Fennellomyces sp. T-0311]
MQQQQPYQQPSKPKPRIDPNQIPSPVQLQLMDEQTYQEEYYGTMSQSPLPLATTNFKAIDQGNCNPRFMRATVKEIPSNSDLIRDSHLPFGLCVQPLADLHPDEEPIPVATTTNPDGPVRCTRCKAYINPACRFTDGGRKFTCNLCEFNNDVPEDYFSHLDMAGQRMDLNERPELQRGTVEFEVPEIYWTRNPTSLRVLFAVDVSYSAVHSGVLDAFCEALKGIMFSETAFPKGTQVGIITFDIAVHFYNLSSSLDQAQMMVVPDVNDMFLPLSSDSFFVDPLESRDVIETLLDSLPTLFTENRAQTAVFGSAIKGGLLALQNTGGKIHVLQTILPTAGPGALKMRDDPKLHGTDKERTLFAPQDALYTAMGKECVNEGVCVDLWAFPMNAYVDISTLGVLSALTGGDTHYFLNFKKERDLQAFASKLERSLTREQGYNAALRVRCSNGFTIDDQFGNFFMNNNTDVEFAGIDADKSVAFKFRHDGKVAEGEAHIQCALLYTTRLGHRRVRIHNLRLPVATSVSALFKQADLDTSMNLLSKQIISQASKKLTQDLMASLDGECVSILAAYRKHCASTASAGQLILPESFKVLPLYALGLKKCAALRKDTNMNIDFRVYNMRKLKSIGVAATIRWLYPRMVPIHTLLNGENTNIPLTRLSCDRLEPTGIYTVEAPDATFVWIGQDVGSVLLENLFGVADLNQINPEMHQLPILDNAMSRQLHQVLGNRLLVPLKIVRQGLDNGYEFGSALVEDETYSQMSYVDYLCMVHKQIQSEASGIHGSRTTCC